MELSFASSPISDNPAPEDLLDAWDLGKQSSGLVMIGRIANRTGRFLG